MGKTCASMGKEKGGPCKDAPITIKNQKAGSKGKDNRKGNSTFNGDRNSRKNTGELGKGRGREEEMAPFRWGNARRGGLSAFYRIALDCRITSLGEMSELCFRGEGGGGEEFGRMHGKFYKR